ncbi:glycosyltransferase [Ectothiorhodospiraceae bacterium BW-2]|nr:glycosyltransferase [Ectothiorhodospiraceae bacterium BW-2]
MIQRLRFAVGSVRIALLWLVKIITHLCGCRRFYYRYLQRQIERSGLFDAESYLKQNPDVQSAAVEPLEHYVRDGDREGRRPHLLFDPSYYRSHRSDFWVKRSNSLLHYLWVGRYCSLSPSPWFDLSYYIARNSDVVQSRVEPLWHFIFYGGQEGRAPSPQFDSRYYLDTNPDVARQRVNPLIHYLQQGRYHNRDTMISFHDATIQQPLCRLQLPLPDSHLWQNLVPRKNMGSAVVDVIMPIYRGKTETLRAIASVLQAATAIDYELIVINDHTPDSELADTLQQLSDDGLFTLINQPRNLGFVATVNRGMEQHQQRDVVLLNSDIEVFDRWLDRLYDHAQQPHTATVTPISNNATICSYPRFLHDNTYQLELEDGQLDQLMEQVNRGASVETPTGVGFCLYIRREVLDRIGLFNVKRYGRGYGEENDFCQRAIVAGYKNRIATDIFVRHWGAVSFQGEREKRIQVAMRRIRRDFPRYHRDVARFIDADPLLRYRYAIDMARLQRYCKRENILIISHDRGGGTERHISEDVQRLMSLNKGVFFLRPLHKMAQTGSFSHPLVRNTPSMPEVVFSDDSAIAELLQRFKISEIHSHGLTDFQPDMATRIGQWCQQYQLRLEVNIHDYKVICPRINLHDRNGYYCGEPDEMGCNRCLTQLGSDFAVTDIGWWRRLHQPILEQADCVNVPSEDVANRLRRYYSELSLCTTPHEEIDINALNFKQPKLSHNEPLHLVIPGAVSAIKGYLVILHLARLIRAQQLPLRLTVMGYTMDDKLLRQEGVVITGRYQEVDGPNMLAQLNPHYVWLPSVWPETYSYTLSLALTTGYPVIAFDIGAIAERLRQLEEGYHLMPLSYARSEQSRQLVNALDSIRAQCCVE